jgi:hypothetical protein
MKQDWKYTKTILQENFSKMKTEQVQLTLEHLAPYLPYCIQITWKNIEDNYVTGVILGTEESRHNEEPTLITIQDVIDLGYKPVLRPLSDIKDEKVAEQLGLDSITIGAILFAEESSKLPQNSDYLVSECIFYKDIVKLIKHHFDVFGLIDKGLAVDMKEFYL